MFFITRPIRRCTLYSWRELIRRHSRGTRWKILTRKLLPSWSGEKDGKGKKFKDSSSGEGYYTDWAMNRMMLITIYNESTKEGKIVAVPIMNIGSGILEKDKDFHQVYEGFGRILCIAPQTV